MDRHAAFLVGALFALGAAAVSTVFFRADLATAHAGHDAHGAVAATARD